MKGSRNVNPLKQVVYRKQKNNSWLKTVVNVEAIYFLFQVIMSATSGDSLITTGKKKQTEADCSQELIAELLTINKVKCEK